MIWDYSRFARLVCRVHGPYDGDTPSDPCPECEAEEAAEAEPECEAGTEEVEK